jgi:hypothetical protein
VCAQARQREEAERLERAKAAEKEREKAARAAEALRVKEAQAAAEAEEKARVIACVIAPDGLPNCIYPWPSSSGGAGGVAGGEEGEGG